MRIRLFPRGVVASVPALVLACSSGVRQTAPVVTTDRPAAPSDAGTETFDAAIASDAMSAEAPPPLRWGTAPPTKADLYVALDGDCASIELHRLANAVFFSDGMSVIAGPGYVVMRTIARFTAAGIEPVGLIKDAYALERIGGHFPDAVFATTWHGGRTVPSGRVYQLEPAPKSTWKMMLPSETDDGLHSYSLPVPWRGGLLVEEQFMPVRKADDDDGQNPPTLSRLITLGPPPAATFRSISTPMPKTDTDFASLSWRALPTGELVVGIVTADRVALTTWGIGATTPFTQTISLAPRASVAILGETSADLRLLTPTPYHLTSGAWVADTTDAATPYAAPSAEDAVQTGGVPGDSWRIEKGIITHDTGSGWKPVQLPAPPFSVSASLNKSPSVQTVLFGPDGELFIVAAYTEKGLGWRKEREREIVYRSHRPDETLRCNEAAPGAPPEDVGSGVQSWPPMATEACKTPFALLTRTSPTQKKDDHRQLLAILTKHKELGPLTVVELRSGNRTFAGVPATSFATGQTIIETVSRSLPIRGELVCADPAPLRTFRVNP